jgi:hypothetical protein
MAHEMAQQGLYDLAAENPFGSTHFPFSALLRLMVHIKQNDQKRKISDVSRWSQRCPQRLPILFLLEGFSALQ